MPQTSTHRARPASGDRQAPKAAAIYCRISDDRTGEGAGVKRQEADCLELAKARGWTVGGIYVDNDLSAYSGKQRPRYEQLLDDLRGGTVDGLLAWHVDRLTRSPRELEEIIDAVEDAGAAVLTVKAGEIDLATATGRQTARIVGAIARGESERMSERIKRKHQELAAAGKLSGGGSRPFGFEDDRRTVRAGEAKRIRDAARRVLAGESMNSILREWNAAGIKTAGGKVWVVSGLRQILVSARISGRREHHGRVTDTAEWPAIISARDSDRLRAVLGPARGRRPGPPARYLLSALLRCGRCGAAMTTSRAATHAADRAKSSEKYATLSYACTRHPRSRPKACGRLRVRGTPLEDLVTNMVFVRVDSPELARLFAERRRGDKRAERTFDVVARLESDLQQLAADLGHGRITYPEWTAARGPLERRLSDARLQLDAEAGTLPLNGFTGKAGSLAKEWPSLSLDRRRAILGLLVDHITVKPADPALPRNRFDPDRIEVAWRR